jgi:hypothetical protein
LSKRCCIFSLSFLYQAVAVLQQSFVIPRFVDFINKSQFVEEKAYLVLALNVISLGTIIYSFSILSLQARNNMESSSGKETSVEVFDLIPSHVRATFAKDTIPQVPKRVWNEENTIKVTDLGDLALTGQNGTSEPSSTASSSRSSSTWTNDKKAPEPQYHVFSSGRKKQLVYIVSLAGLFSPLSSNIYFPALGAIADVSHT